MQNKIYMRDYVAYQSDPREIHDNGKPVHEYYPKAMIEELLAAIQLCHIYYHQDADEVCSIHQINREVRTVLAKYGYETEA